MHTRQQGEHYEQFAREWLQQRGLQFIDNNVSCRFGEIDLIMLEQDCLCFVEVKFRRSMGFGGSAYSISAAKQRKLILAANDYLTKHPKFNHRPARFDAMLLQSNSDGQIDVNWIPNAFGID